MPSRDRRFSGEPSGRLGEVVWLSVRLGLTAFGGPAAHIAMLRSEVVDRRRWVGDNHFLDLLSVTNLIPGPNSTEMVIHVGYERAGWRGLVAGGVGFILPAATMTLGFAWLYVAYGTTPAGDQILYGIKPVVIAIVVQALWSLARTALRGIPAGVGCGLVAALYLAGVHEIALLFGGGLVGLGARARQLGIGQPRAMSFTALPFAGWPAWADTVTGPLVDYGHIRIFLTFLKIGSVLYGSGYVLLAFLRNDIVDRYGWLTEQQLVDAMAVGQFTPGPVFTTATFVGYVAGGVPGAVLATVGIFLPAFVAVAVAVRLLPRLRRMAWARAALDGLNVAALGLMAAVAWTLARAALVDWFTLLVAAVALVVLLRYRVNSAWLVLGGALLGLGTSLFS